ncbi:ABC transporter permease, partial [Rhizobium ruizarguesonis]
TIMAPSSQLGILAIAASLLMICGEFDLSIGSMLAFAGLIFGVILTNFGQPLSVAIVMTICPLIAPMNAAKSIVMTM